MRTTKGPAAWKTSTQCLHWTFSSPEKLHRFRCEAHSVKVASVVNNSTARPQPRCLPLSSSSGAGASSGGSSSSTATAADDERLLTQDEEQRYVAKFQQVILDKWVPNFPPLCRSGKIGATAVALFRRFFLSNSVMEHDPEIVGLACVWLASKTEGTQGFVHALPPLPQGHSSSGAAGGDGNNDNSHAVAAGPEDRSIQETVPLMGRPRTDPRRWE